MVRWKGDIERSSCGEKAANLDRADSLNVPNFFVLTSKETKSLADSIRNSERPEEVSVPEEVSSKVKDAYKEVDMSSAVRNASGPARNLVGGQRKGSRVSIRVSSDEKGRYEYVLHAGSSELEEGLKKVVASYVEQNDDSPAVMFQRMIEPEATGAAVLNYTEDAALVEAVKGLGDSLENGRTVPEMYLVGDSVRESRVPENQIEASLNPMKGEVRSKEIDREHGMFSGSELENFVQKLRSEGASAKFVYKRGTFYVVDVFERGHGKGPDTLDRIRATHKEVRERQAKKTRQPEKPDSYREGLIASKGGYTSSAAQLARQEGKAAVFSFKGEEGEDSEPVEEDNNDRGVFPPAEESGSTPKKRRSDQETREPAETAEAGEAVTATRVLPLNSSGGLSLKPPYDGSIAVTRAATDGRAVDPDCYVSSASEVLKFDGEELVLDARSLETEVAAEATEYIDADFKALILGSDDQEMVEYAVRQRFDAVAVREEQLEEVRKEAAREERRMLLDHAAGELE